MTYEICCSEKRKRWNHFAARGGQSLSFVARLSLFVGVDPQICEIRFT